MAIRYSGVMMSETVTVPRGERRDFVCHSVPYLFTYVRYLWILWLGKQRDD